MFSAKAKRKRAVGVLSVWLGAASVCWPQASPGSAAPAVPASEQRLSLAQANKTITDSSSDSPAQPAKLKLNDGILTVDANNSDLTQILQYLANISGMSIKGLDKGPRVFGIYGPGKPRDVLSALLIGTGYNFLMLGNTGVGTPRELVLTPQKKAFQASESSGLPEASTTGSGRPVEDQPARQELGPGAVYPVPPPPPQDENMRIQQNLQRLQRIHEQQENVHQTQ